MKRATVALAVLLLIAGLLGPLAGVAGADALTPTAGDEVICSVSINHDWLYQASDDALDVYCYYNPSITWQPHYLYVRPMWDPQAGGDLFAGGFDSRFFSCAFTYGSGSGNALPAGSLTAHCSGLGSEPSGHGYRPANSVDDSTLCENADASGRCISGVLREQTTGFAHLGYTDVHRDRARPPQSWYGSPASITDLSCDHVYQFSGPAPTDTIAAGAEVTLGFVWHLTLGATPIDYLSFTPGDGGPAVVNAHPVNDSENHGQWTFTFTKATNGTLATSRLACRDHQGYTTDRTLPQQGALPPALYGSGDACLASISIGLNPASWVPALLSGGSCVVQALFVPTDPGAHFTAITHAADGTLVTAGTDLIGQLHDAWTGMVTNADSGDCHGPTVDLPIVPGQGAVAMRPLEACSGGVHGIATTTHLILSLGIAVGGAVVLINLLMSVWGGPQINNDSVAGGGSGQKDGQGRFVL